MKITLYEPNGTKLAYSQCTNLSIETGSIRFKTVDGYTITSSLPYKVIG